MSAKTNEGAKNKRPKQPTVGETRQQMAESGDVDGLWQILATTRWSLLDGEEIFQLLLRAVEVQSAKDPAQFAQVLFSRMVGFTGYSCFARTITSPRRSSAPIGTTGAPARAPSPAT